MKGRDIEICHFITKRQCFKLQELYYIIFFDRAMTYAFRKTQLEKVYLKLMGKNQFKVKVLELVLGAIKLKKKQYY
jgi:hypothetical protein